MLVLADKRKTTTKIAWAEFWRERERERERESVKVQAGIDIFVLVFP